VRTVILYHPNAEFAGLAEDYKRDFERRHGDRKVELISLDEAKGAEMAELYDVVRYPAVLVIASDGQLQKLWQDQPFPLMDEVAAYSVLCEPEDGRLELSKQS
jgi:hypothetical protein